MVLCQKYRVGLRQAFEERGSTTFPPGDSYVVSHTPNS